ncbi:hypothetical protein, partial [Apilactobacillus xinyiensis]|uniref:hypothetical protein n=1 Tax=Apilactobacillus xinyiensis TaxID=2841032 RepID=UPI001C7CBEEB
MFSGKRLIFSLLVIFFSLSFSSFIVRADNAQYRKRIIKTVQDDDGLRHRVVEDDFFDDNLDVKKINGFTFYKSIILNGTYCYLYNGNKTNLTVKYMDNYNSLVLEKNLSKISVGGSYNLKYKLDDQFKICDSEQLNGILDSENKTLIIKCINLQKTIDNDARDNHSSKENNNSEKADKSNDVA